MARRSTVTADEAERTELRALARSAHRGEAERAGAILMTLDGWPAANLAGARGVHVSTVREWRGRVAVLRRRPPPGRSAVVGPRAAALAAAILGEDERHEGGWTRPRLRAEIRRRGGPAASAAWLSRQLRKGGSPGAGPGTRSRAGRILRPSGGPAAGSTT